MKMAEETPKALGSLLVTQRFITEPELQRLKGLSPAELVNTLLCSCAERQEELAQLLASYMGLESVSSQVMVVDSSVTELVALAEKHQLNALPLCARNGVIDVAVDNPLDLHLLERAGALFSARIRPIVASRQGIAAVRNRHLNAGARLTLAAKGIEISDSRSAQESESASSNDDAPVVRLVNTLLHSAMEREASDIHIEGWTTKSQIRFRIDGVMQEAMEPLPASLHEAVITRLKVMADLDVAERQKPQDGRFSFAGIDVRISLLPGVREGAALRLLKHADITASRWQLDHLGFPSEISTGLRRAVKQPQGLVLITGPTGSGKTTTLYAALGEFDAKAEKIITIEDPVEYRLDGIMQIAVNERKKLTFASGLRSILRHDPDKIMVGEIRDRETADIAVQSAMTGHLVLSTLHANGAFEAISRLLHMGIEREFVADSLVAVLTQRLVRRLCPRCKEVSQRVSDELDISEEEKAQFSHTTIYRAKGCSECHFTGYKGREAIGEFVRINSVLQDELRKGDGGAVRHLARLQGMRSIREAAKVKVLEGLTSLEEVERVIGMA